MYHHIQDMESAKAQGHAGLTVSPDEFQKQMQYLKDKGYTVTKMENLVAFFDNGIPMPKKSVLLTFDDGYDDFYTNAYPVLHTFAYPATLFVPTGLIENPGYVNWTHITGMAAGGVLMTNHTWSHHSVISSHEEDVKEISTADQQLAARGLDSPKIFAYPYGPANVFAEQYLASLGYKAAFTTHHGATLCKKQRFTLPRIRIGDAPLSAYGL